MTEIAVGADITEAGGELVVPKGKAVTIRLYGNTVTCRRVTVGGALTVGDADDARHLHRVQPGAGGDPEMRRITAFTAVSSKPPYRGGVGRSDWFEENVAFPILIGIP